MAEEETDKTLPDETTEEEEQKDYQALYEAEVKAGAGKDKKVSNLLTRLSKFEEGEQKRTKERERLERQNMNADQLQAYIDRKIEEIEANAEREIQKKDVTFNEYKRKNRILDAASQVENLPPGTIQIITRDWPDDPDEIKEILQNFVDINQTRLDQHRLVIDNKRRVASRPQGGDTGKPQNLSDKEWERIPEDERQFRVDSANLDELKKKIKDDMGKPEHEK